MRCKRIRRRLSAYLDGELPTERMGRIEAHLAACPSCQREVQAMASAYALLDSGTAVTVPDDLVFRRPAEAPTPRAGERLRAARGLGWSWAAAACVVGLLIGVGIRTTVHYIQGQVPPSNSVSAQRRYVNAWNLDALADLPPDSVGGVYTALRRNER